MKKLLFVLLMVLSGQVMAAQEFDATDKWLLAASTMALAADWSQTRYIAKHPDKFSEKNPILGKHPSTQRVDVYFAASIAANYFIANALPSAYRKTWLTGVTVFELGFVRHNYSIGIRSHF